MGYFQSGVGVGRAVSYSPLVDVNLTCSDVPGHCVFACVEDGKRGVGVTPNFSCDRA